MCARKQHVDGSLREQRSPGCECPPSLSQPSLQLSLCQRNAKHKCCISCCAVHGWGRIAATSGLAAVQPSAAACQWPSLRGSGQKSVAEKRAHAQACIVGQQSVHASWPPRPDCRLFKRQATVSCGLHATVSFRPERSRSADAAHSLLLVPYARFRSKQLVLSGVLLLDLPGWPVLLRSQSKRPVSALTSKRHGPVSLSRSAQRGTAGVRRSGGFASEFRPPATDTPALTIVCFPAHFLPPTRALCQVKEKATRRVNHGANCAKDRGLPQQKEVSGSFHARPMEPAGVGDGMCG